MNKLRKVVQYWESEDGIGYTVKTEYNDAGVGTVTDSRPPLVDFAAAKAAQEDLNQLHSLAVEAVRASVAAGELTPAAGDEAIARLNRERLSVEASSGMTLAGAQAEQRRINALPGAGMYPSIPGQPERV